MSFKDGVGICYNDLYFLRSWRLAAYFTCWILFDIRRNYIVSRFLLDASSGPSLFDSASDQAP